MVLMTEGPNAFHHAVFSESKEMLTFLIEKHADLLVMEHKDHKDRTKVDKVAAAVNAKVWSDKTLLRLSPLSLAAQRNQVDMVHALLAHKHVEVTGDFFFWPLPLDTTLDAVTKFSQAADGRIVTVASRTALHFAAEAGRDASVIEALIAGVSGEPIVDQPARAKNKMQKKLLETRDTRGLTALGCSVAKKHTDTALTLMRHMELGAVLSPVPKVANYLGSKQRGVARLIGSTIFHLLARDQNREEMRTVLDAVLARVADEGLPSKRQQRSKSALTVGATRNGFENVKDSTQKRSQSADDEVIIWIWHSISGTS